MGNAFLHCSWTGAIAAWHGFDTAVGIGENHEYYRSDGEGIAQMDLANNEVGARTGDDARVASSYPTWEYADDTWGYVMDTCEAMARNGALFGICGIQGDYLPSDYPHDPNAITCGGGGGW